MLTYQIVNQKAQPNHQLNSLIVDRKEALDRHLDKFPRFRVGDRVRFKKPKRNPITGTVTHIERDWQKVNFTNGVPHHITVELDKHKIVGGRDTLKASCKKLVYIGNV